MKFQAMSLFVNDCLLLNARLDQINTLHKYNK